MSIEYDPYTDWSAVQIMILSQESENIMHRLRFINDQIELLEYERDVENKKLRANSFLLNQLKARHDFK